MPPLNSRRARLRACLNSGRPSTWEHDARAARWIRSDRFARSGAARAVHGPPTGQERAAVHSSQSRVAALWQCRRSCSIAREWAESGHRVARPLVPPCPVRSLVTSRDTLLVLIILTGVMGVKTVQHSERGRGRELGAVVSRLLSSAAGAGSRRRTVKQ